MCKAQCESKAVIIALIFLGCCTSWTGAAHETLSKQSQHYLPQAVATKFPLSTYR